MNWPFDCERQSSTNKLANSQEKTVHNLLSNHNDRRLYLTEQHSDQNK
jgi:hypothetical protein